MKRIFRRARSLPVTVLCLLAAPALAVGPGALESAGQKARRRAGPRGPLSGAARPVRDGGFGRQAPPSYLKETLTFTR